MQNQQMPNQVTTATVEGARDRERPCKRWSGKIQEDLNVMRIKKNWSETVGNGGRLYWRPRCTTDCSAVGGGRGGGEEEEEEEEATEEKEK
jgi:hypothetical protein